MTDFKNPDAVGSFKNSQAEIDYWEKQFKLCEQLRKSYEENWYLNLAFYFSKQWVVWQRSIQGNRLLDPAAPRNRVRLIANRIKPIVRIELTKLIKEEPQFYVVPNTTEPTDVAAARVGESIAEFVLKDSKYNKVRRQATFWTLICGSGFTKTTCPGVDEDLVLEKVTAFHIFVQNLDDENVQTQPYVIHGRGMYPEIIEQTYGVKVDPDMQANGVSIEQKFFDSIGIKNKGAQENKLVYVKEIWVKPCKRYPNGALLVIAGNKVVYRYTSSQEMSDPMSVSEPPGDEFPYEHGEYPFVKMDHTASGRFYGASTIEDLIPLQKEYNKTRSQILESKNRMAKPQMTYTKGSIDVNKITSEVGLYIPVAPGFNPPTAIAIQPLPQYVLEELNRILEDMDEIAGTNEIARGRVPTGIQAASAIAYLAEQNDSKIYNTVVSIEEATADIGRQVLSLVEQFWTEEKIISIVSKNNSFEASVFKISALKGNTDLRVETGSMAPKSPAARQAFITDLMVKGLIPPEKGLRYLQMNETSRLYDELQIDAKQAQRENFRMSQGQQCVPNTWDNDPTHIYEHELYMKSQEFEMSDSATQQIFIQHLDATKMKVIQNNAPGIGQPTSSDPSIRGLNGQQQPAAVGAG